MTRAAVYTPGRWLTDEPTATLDLAEPSMSALRQLQDAVGGYVESVDLAPGIVMWVNEDGRRLNLPPNLAATTARTAAGHYPALVLGTAAVTAYDDDGNEVDLPDDWRERIAEHRTSALGGAQ